jgi:sialate O-acetylesterase
MAVLNDAGEVSDIHPRNKVDAGKRLSLWALAKDYGRTDLVYSGPLYESSKTSGNKVTIQFSHVGEGLMTARKHLLEPARPIDEHVQGFQICGADKTWKWARAKIISPSEVEVYHPEIDQPVEVRYAWSANPENANLYNKSGLPTSCFTTLD